MLLTLSMRNVALIESLTLEFQRGLHVMTGETGAGKSIVIDSIGAVLGRRVSRDLVRSGAHKGFVSAVFTGLSPALAALLDELLRTKRLPVAQLSAGSGIERKTLERHRKYMVALLLIYTNGYEILRGHLMQVMKGAAAG